MDETTDDEANAPNVKPTAEDGYDVAIVGGGVAGLTAGIYTARAGLTTLVVDAKRGSILRRNAHLENVPGFPAGVSSQLFLDMTREQAERAGCAFFEGIVTDIEHRNREFTLEVTSEGVGIETDEGEESETIRATRVIAASWSDASYLEGLDVEFEERGSKRFVLGREESPAAGRTGVEGLYAAGRLAAQYHQTVVAAGHGAQVALTLLHDADVPLYHDWVAPEGYFTDRDRDVPPGIEEVSENERRRRERESMAVMREYFSDPYPDEPLTHPSLVDDE